MHAKQIQVLGTVNKPVQSGQVEKELEANVFLNRAGIVTRADFQSSIYRGDKGALIGEPALAALSFTSRVFGFCGGSHQQAAARALEHMWKSTVPANAKIVRSIAQAAEILQNTNRWFYSTLAPDLANHAFAEHPIFEEVANRFSSFKGSSFRRGIMSGTYPIRIYSQIAGQWPHADFAVPGGIVPELTPAILEQVGKSLEQYRRQWIEGQLLADSLEHYLAIETWPELLAWAEEDRRYERSDLALLIKASLVFGLDRPEKGPERFLSCGAFPDPGQDLVTSPEHYSRTALLPGGFLQKSTCRRFVPDALAELLADTGLQDINYQQKSVAVGSLARMNIAAHSGTSPLLKPSTLVRNILREKGPGIFTRVFARLHEACLLYGLIDEWLPRVKTSAPFIVPVNPQDGTGIGMTEAPRGALMHYVEVQKGKIARYEILAPTLLNIRSGSTSPLAAALQGIEVKDPENPIEIGMVARSFDTCLVCNINFRKNKSGKLIRRVRI